MSIPRLVTHTRTTGTHLPLAVIILLQVSAAPSCAGDHLDLSGQWRFQLDADDRGLEAAWFTRQLADAIQLPGSLQEQGFGDTPSLDTKWTGGIIDRSFFELPRYAPYRSPENFKVPFWLQPRKCYVGAAWYQRDVDIPADWVGKRIVLRLERCHWQTTVWVNDQNIGTRNSLSTPHEYDLTGTFAPASEAGATNTITIRVDNRIQDINVGPNSHSIADHTQTNWNGIVGDLELIATDRVWIENVQVYPAIETKTARVKVTLRNGSRNGVQGTLLADAQAANTDASHDPPQLEVSVACGSNETTMVEFDYALGNATQLWDEFQPTLYQLSLVLRGEAGEARFHDETSVRFGMREVDTMGTQFVINGQPISLRGTLECCIFPKTGYPPTDVDQWRRVIRVCQAHGLNHMRFHSHCPPRAAFVAADELGFYFQVECGSWANQGASVGDGKPLDKWLYGEADRILQAYGNHPSFLLMAYGNEPAGPDRGGQYLGPWVTHYKQRDPRRIYTSAAGWPMIAENQYHNTPTPRIHQWGMGLQDRLNGQPPATIADYREFVSQHKVPVVSHEIGEWCVYPNFDEISKYTGVLQAKNFEVFRDFLTANHMGDQAHDFLMASGKLQTLCYKEEIESALRTPGFGGFQLLDLHDFPGQGTALVGVLDAFWDSKPYVTPNEFRRFCNCTVPLARLPKRIFAAGETLEATVDVYHFGPRDFANAVVAWELLQSDGSTAASGTVPHVQLPRGKLSKAGVISVGLPKTATAQKFRLVVSIPGTDYQNDWGIWVYPRQAGIEPSKDILIAERLDAEALASLSRGRKVLLTPRPESVDSDVAVGFSSVFWNTAWTRNQAPHTLGILCNPDHPALALFPTEFHTNWQWWELIHRSSAMVLDDLPPQLRPTVQVIDTWFEARRLGFMFEAAVGGGRLLVCSMDIDHNLDSRPVARQMRHSLLRYMDGDGFQPEVTVSVDEIRGLFRSK